MYFCNITKNIKIQKNILNLKYKKLKAGTEKNMTKCTKKQKKPLTKLFKVINVINVNVYKNNLIARIRALSERSEMKRSTIGYFLMAVLLALSHITLADTTDEDASADILIMKPILFNGTELIKAFLDVEELDEECLTVKERGNPVTIITKYEKDNQKITANCSKGTLGTVIMEVRGQEEKTQEERIEQWLQILERLNISVDEQVEITWGGTDSKGRKLSLFCSGKWNSYLSNGLHHRR